MIKFIYMKASKKITYHTTNRKKLNLNDD